MSYNKYALSQVQQESTSLRIIENNLRIGG